MDIKRLEGESLTDWKFRVLLAKSKKEIEHSWKDIHEELETGLSIDTVTKGTIFFPEFEKYIIKKYKLTQDEMPNYKESVTINKDGSQLSDRLVQLSEQEMKDEKAVLNAHGYDASEWEITSAKNSMYHVNAKGGITKLLYSSKISVRKKENSFDIDKLVESLTKNIKPYKRKEIISSGKNLLELGFTDMHFGICNLEHYKETIDETISLINSKKWDTIFIPIGSDALHNNDLSKGLTANGTPIEKVNMEQAWEEAYRFYSIIIESCLDNSKNVVAKYVCGNHDKDISFGMVKALSKVYTEVEWDTTADYKKMFIWKDIAILWMHGDKGNQQRITKSAYQDYGKIIADKKCFEIHTGDKHHTVVNDSHGVVFRILPTGAITDNWHFENSFSGNSKCFHLFEYKEDRLKTIYHV